jgi:glucans biosynthesis protein C
VDRVEHPVRLVSIDRLRLALTVGVIASHAVITYAGNGSWFYHEGRLPPMVETAVAFPLALGSLFAMGTFFFLAGAFLPPALERHGSAVLLRERSLRLGVPVLAFVLVVVPLVKWWASTQDGPYESPAAAWTAQLHQLDAGPCWFVWVLLVFTAASIPALSRLGPAVRRAPRARLLVGCGLLVAAASFTLRIRFPIDSYQPGAAHVWQWGQCTGLFLLGLLAGRQGWLTTIPARIRKGCIGVVVVGVLATVGLLIAFADDLDPLGGGLHWQSLLVAVVEGAMSVSCAVVLVTLFGNGSPGRRGTAVARLAYGAYLAQTPVLVGVALALRGVPLPTTVKLVVLLPLAVLISFAAAAKLRRVPGLRTLLR